MEGTFYLATADDIQARRIGESKHAVTNDIQTFVKSSHILCEADHTYLGLCFGAQTIAIASGNMS
jgi:GMP synthase-like glutamine amidotransferase